MFDGFGMFAGAVIVVIAVALWLMERDPYRGVNEIRIDDGPDRVWIVDESSGSGPSRPPTIIGESDSRDAAVRTESGAGARRGDASERSLFATHPLDDGVDLG
jgi:hypothetical protein